MKSKLKAGVVATLISLFVLVALAILMVAIFDTEPSDGLTKIIAFAIIGIWIGLYTWLRPKGTPTILEKLEKKISDKEVQVKEVKEAKAKAEVEKTSSIKTETKERNSYK